MTIENQGKNSKGGLPGCRIGPVWADLPKSLHVLLIDKIVLHGRSIIIWACPKRAPHTPKCQLQDKANNMRPDRVGVPYLLKGGDLFEVGGDDLFEGGGHSVRRTPSPW